MKINFKYQSEVYYPLWKIDVDKLEQRVWKWWKSDTKDWDIRLQEYLYDGNPIPSILDDPRINAGKEMSDLQKLEIPF